MASCDGKSGGDSPKRSGGLKRLRRKWAGAGFCRRTPAEHPPRPAAAGGTDGGFGKKEKGVVKWPSMPSGICTSP